MSSGKREWPKWFTFERIEPLEGLAEGRTSQEVRSRVVFAQGDSATVTVSLKIDAAPESPPLARPAEKGRRDETKS